ncbi:MAG: ROK family protein [Oligoflexia bacterium]|nr:ROK family protein [Oligoflexia bacterium]
MLLGFDIGGTKLAVSAGNRAGEIFRRYEAPTGGAAAGREFFVSAGRKLTQEYSSQRLEACGVSAPGPMSSVRGILLNPPNLSADWHQAPVRTWIEQAFGVPVAMENDANAGAVAEWLWGFNKQVDNLVYLTCGTGMGAGLVLNSKLYRGKQDLAGEVGHARLRSDGPVGFYKAGSLEGFTSGTALGNLAALRLKEPHAPSTLDSLPVLSGKVVGVAAIAGDALAQEIVRQSGAYLGEFIGNLIDTLNPERVSLGSLAVRLGSLYIDAVREAAKREALPDAYNNCVIDVAILGPRVQDLAALAIAPGN